MGERWLTFKVWLGSILMGNEAWGYYLQKVRDAKDEGAIPSDWPSNRLRSLSPSFVIPHPEDSNTSDVLVGDEHDGSG